MMPSSRYLDDFYKGPEPDVVRGKVSTGKMQGAGRITELGFLAQASFKARLAQSK